MKFQVLFVAALLALSGQSVYADEDRMPDKRSREIIEDPDGGAGALAWVVRRGSDAYARTAWDVMQRRPWEVHDYTVILGAGREPYSTAAWERLKTESVSRFEDVAKFVLLRDGSGRWNQAICEDARSVEVSMSLLASIIEYSHGPCQQSTYERFLTKNPTIPQLWQVAEHGEGSIKSDALKRIWDREAALTPGEWAWLTDRDSWNPENSDSHSWCQCGRAWRRLLDRGASSEVLVAIVANGGHYSPRAWDILYLRGPSNDDLRRIMESPNLNKDFRLEVATMLGKRIAP